MRIIPGLLIALCLVSLSAMAQNKYSVKGTVADTVVNVNLVNTTVCLLNAKDSTLYKYTRVNANGGFRMDDLKKGRFILMVSYPDYADYIDHFNLDSIKSDVDFGKIAMILKERLLHEVMIKGKKDAIKIKGDTTEFNASSFVIQPNAKVEDLLKQLPGIQVDKDGKITAQGQTVNKVLVDGEEFFGDDPTLVTKNIRADMVDKVQLYDKKSDQATFTGIDDGVKNKTINLKLKEDKKNGYFGKVTAGIGNDGYYEGQGAYNKFVGKQKFSAYGTIGNDGKTGLSWQDNSKYSSSDNSGMQFTDDGGIYITSNGRDEFESFSGTYNGQGLPLARTGGAHYDSKWNADKQSINTNYKIGYLAVNGANNTLTQNNLPDTVLKSNSNQDYTNSAFRQKLDGTYQLKIDSLSNLKISVDGTVKHNETHNTYSASSYRDVKDMETLLNLSDRKLNNNSDQKLVNASIFYNKKFMKPGRSFSVNLSEAYNQNITDGYLNSTIQYFDAQTGKLSGTQLINQHKTSNVTGSNLTSNITYSEPFTKTFAMIVNYGTGYNSSMADRKSFDQNPIGEYTKLNDTLSNNYQFNQLSNQIGTVFNYRTVKTVITFGTKATNVDFAQTNEYTNITLKRNFINWTPQASYQYKFSQQKSISFNYNGNTSQPTIDQIQPVLVNTDPLNVTLGNADLKPSFRNNFNLNFNSYKVLTDQNIYVGANYSFTSNQIVGNTTTDTKTGKTTYQYFNLTDKHPYNFSMYSYMGWKIKKINLNIAFNTNINGNTSYNYSNSALNKTDSYTFSGQLDLDTHKEKKYDIWMAFGPAYNISQSSLQLSTNNNGLGYNGYGGCNIYLPWKLAIETNGNYQYTPKTGSFNQSLEKFILNASISKKFLKDEGLVFKLSGNDLLNQNVGFSRNAYGSVISQNSYTSIKRYFMFSIIYDFSRMGGAPAKK
jgi:hypothetical protein